MKLIFFGTGTAFPTPERNHSGTYIDIGPEALLFDCGEGTQRQMAAAKISPAKIYKIWAVKTLHPVPCLAYKYVKKPLRRINIGYVEKFGIRTPNPILRKLADGKNIKWEGKLITY